MGSYLRIRHERGLTTIFLIFAFVPILVWVLKFTQFRQSSAQIILVLWVLEVTQLLELFGTVSGGSVEWCLLWPLAFVAGLVKNLQKQVSTE